MELEKAAFFLTSLHFIFPTLWGSFSNVWALGPKEVKKVPKVTQLVRLQTRAHLTLEPRLFTDTLVIFTILCAKDFPSILTKNIDSCTSVSEVLIQPIQGRVQKPAFKSIHPRDFEACGHTEHNLQTRALYFLDVLLGKRNTLVVPKHFKTRAWLLIIKIFPT